MRADAGVFGEKDWPQVMVIRRVVADLALPITIETVPTEADFSEAERLYGPGRVLGAAGLGSVRLIDCLPADAG
jgi:pantothenate synthetase